MNTMRATVAFGLASMLLNLPACFKGKILIGDDLTDGGDSGSQSCTLRGQVHASGEAFACADGCNTCRCNGDEIVAITGYSCPPPGGQAGGLGTGGTTRSVDGIGGTPNDSGAIDATPNDSGAIDAAPNDSGAIDATPNDSGAIDATNDGGAIDAAPNDGGTNDGGKSARQALCGLNPEGILTPTTTAGQHALAVGLWWPCGESFFGPNSREAALSITDDNTWHKMYFIDGALVPGTAATDSGPFRMSSNNEDGFSLGLQTSEDGGGTYPSQTQFSFSPRMMKMDNYLAYNHPLIVYVAETQFGASPSGCVVPPTHELAVTDKAQMEASITGRWLTCAGSVTSADEAGLEFKADGSWQKLVAGPQGVLRRASGFESEGTWKIDDRSSPPSLDMPIGLGISVATPRFYDHPLEMVFAPYAREGTYLKVNVQ